MPVDVFARGPLAGGFARSLLDWYDTHARTLPWRSPPGMPPPDRYRVWLSEVMLQQTTVAAVAPYFERFVARWPTVAALAAAPDADVMQAWAGLGYYARARNLLACARVVAASGWPGDEAGLRTLPGVGAYTAAAIASIAFGEPAVVVDGNVERVMARLFAVATPLPAARSLLRAHAATLTPWHRPGDYAQALMDLGATVCMPRSPRCGACPVRGWCTAQAIDDPARFPVKTPRMARPLRYATAFRLEVAGHVLLVRRPPRGLLGGMRALPSTTWSDAPHDWRAAVPVAADWHLTSPPVRHIFTHFELHLTVATASLAERPDVAGEWWPVDRFAEAGLPTLFAKALR